MCTIFTFSELLVGENRVETDDNWVLTHPRVFTRVIDYPIPMSTSNQCRVEMPKLNLMAVTLIYVYLLNFCLVKLLKFETVTVIFCFP